MSDTGTDGGLRLNTAGPIIPGAEFRYGRTGRDKSGIPVKADKKSFGPGYWVSSDAPN